MPTKLKARATGRPAILEADQRPYRVIWLVPLGSETSTYRALLARVAEYPGYWEGWGLRCINLDGKDRKLKLIPTRSSRWERTEWKAAPDSVITKLLATAEKTADKTPDQDNGKVNGKGKEKEKRDTIPSPSHPPQPSSLPPVPPLDPPKIRAIALPVGPPAPAASNGIAAGGA
jgi:hypothetical protein